LRIRYPHCPSYKKTRSHAATGGGGGSGGGGGGGGGCECGGIRDGDMQIWNRDTRTRETLALLSWTSPVRAGSKTEGARTRPEYKDRAAEDGRAGEPGRELTALSGRLWEWEWQRECECVGVGDSVSASGHVYGD
jgi:hypothetical protein